MEHVVAVGAGIEVDHTAGAPPRVIAEVMEGIMTATIAKGEVGVTVEVEVDLAAIVVGEIEEIGIGEIETVIGIVKAEGVEVEVREGHLVTVEAEVSV